MNPTVVAEILEAYLPEDQRIQPDGEKPRRARRATDQAKA